MSTRHHIDAAPRSQDHLTPEQAQKLSELWTAHERFLERLVRDWEKHRADILSDLGLALSRRKVFQMMAPDYSEKAFRGVCRGCLRIILMRLLERLAKERELNRRIRRLASRRTPTPLELAIRHEERELVRKEINDLANRQSLVDYFFEGRTFQETAQHLGHHERTIRRQVHGALSLLRLRLPTAADPAFAN